MNTLIFTLVMGVGATLLSDLWGFARKPLLGVPAPDYAFVGRWIGHMPRGIFRHAGIARAPAVHGERALGWLVHYAVGIAFATLLVAIGGFAWMQAPTPGLALAIGIATVAAPFCVMQPAMGAGFAASRTPKPNAARMQSLLMHTLFGLGLYFSALIAQQFLSQ
jgi:hypothetical protein